MEQRQPPPAVFPYVLLHDGHPALYLTRRRQSGEALPPASETCFPDGRTPGPSEAFACGTCGQALAAPTERQIVKRVGAVHYLPMETASVRLYFGEHEIGPGDRIEHRVVDGGVEVELVRAPAAPVKEAAPEPVAHMERLLQAFRELRMVTLPPHDISGRRMYDKAVSLYEQVAREQRDQDAGPEHVYHLFRREHPAMSYTAGQLYVGTFTTFADVVAAAREGGGRFDVALSRGDEVAWSEIEEERLP